MLLEFGFPYLWICVGNVVAVGLLQWAGRDPRPIDLDRHLIDYHTDPDTFGFPSIESHMSIVVLVPVIGVASNLVVQLLLIALIGLIGLTRVYANIRFPSQIVASWCTGALGLMLGTHGALSL